MQLWSRPVVAKRRFCLVLVKPTHYCDDGYPIQWIRSAVPSNSLACLAGIVQHFADQNVLGPDVEIDIHIFDEANTRIRPARVRSSRVRRVDRVAAGSTPQ